MDFDVLKDKAKQLADKTAEKANELNETRKKSNQEIKIKLTSKNLMGASVKNIRKDVNGLYYIGGYSETAPRFTIENLEFNGSKIIQRTAGETKQKGRLGSALVGGALLGHAGAIAGASRGRKGKINTTTTTEEKPGKGLVYLRSVETNEVQPVPFVATQSEFSNIERFFT